MAESNEIKFNSDTRWCKRCIMNDAVDQDIRFDEDGICHHCRRYDAMLSQRTVAAEERTESLERLVQKIKASGSGKRYDCLIGVSGGVDSTYVAWLAKNKLGLRPLAVHLDNGWNSELAVANIEKTMRRLNIDLTTVVLDWSEFKDLQIAFLRSSTTDGEIPTDHAIFATLWKTAAKHRIKYILSGMNFATESMSAANWSYGHSDWKYIRAIQRGFGTKKLKSYPHFSFFDLLWINLVRGVRTISILNYVDFQKQEAMEMLQSELGWVYYGGKHYESIYTRFWQGAVLPSKFNIDKRYGHLSDLIKSGQITREEALNEAKKNPYSTKDLLVEDRCFVEKKFGMSSQELDQILNSPPRSYTEFPNSADTLARLKKIANWLRGRGLYPK